jgi:hypothetical protein
MFLGREIEHCLKDRMEKMNIRNKNQSGRFIDHQAASSYNACAV